MFREGFVIGRDVDLHKFVKENETRWSILTNEEIAIHFNVSANTLGCTPDFYPIGHYDIPIYVRVFYKIIKSSIGNCLISITDKLPLFFSISVKKNFNLKKERKNVLEQLAILIIPDEVKMNANKLDIIKFKIDKIIASDVNIKKALDEFVRLVSNDQVVHYSLCIACRKKIEKDKVVCSRIGIEEPWKCWNNIVYRVKARFGIKEMELVRSKIEELNAELNDLIQYSPLSAYDDFHQKHKKDLFQDNRTNKPKKGKQ